MNKRVFIGMETSGALRRRFQAAGFDAVSCDMLPAEDGGDGHIVGDVWRTLSRMIKNRLTPDLAVFHITCTYLTSSAEWAFKDPDYMRYPGVGYHQRLSPGTLFGAERRAAREASKDEFRRVLKLPIKMKVVENPVGALSSIRPPSQIIQPYQFGDNASKATCLWFIDEDGDELPGMKLRLDERLFVQPRWFCGSCRTRGRLNEVCVWCGGESYLPRWGNQTASGQNKLGVSPDRWKTRSRTFDGIADAMVRRWSRLLRSPI